MTNLIENTGYRMYGALAAVKGCIRNGIVPCVSVVELEDGLEAHLEALRQELKTAHEDAEGANILKNEFQQRLMRMTEERDQIQGRLHAIDEAYDKSQRALGVAGEEIQHLQTLLKANIEIACTSQDSRENSSSGDKEANALMIVLGALIDSQAFITGWPIGALKAKKAMLELEGILTTGKLRKAMKVFEQPGDDAMLRECAHSYRGMSGCPECGLLFGAAAQ